MPDQDNQKRLQDETTTDDDAVKDGGINPHEPTNAPPNPLDQGTSTVMSPNIVEETDRVPTAPNSQANFAGNETPNPPEYKEPSTTPDLIDEPRQPNARDIVERTQAVASKLSNAVVSGNVTRQLLDEVNAELSQVGRDADRVLSEDAGVTN